MKLRYILIMLLVAFVALQAACGPAETPEPTVEATEAPDPADITADSDETPGTENESNADAAGPPEGFAGLDYTTTESGLQYVIVEEGSGEQAEMGNIVRVHYTGTLADGTEFDSSSQSGEPLQFAVGRGQVIPGWDEGIALLQEGDKAKLIIPAELAYGATGAGGVIPPGATLYFDVELVEVLPGAPESPAAVDEADYTETDTGLQYYDLEEGEGEAVGDGDPVVLHYTAWLEDGTLINSSIETGRPMTFVVGSDQVFPGLNEGVAGMNVGGHRQLLIPPELAFGSEGAAGVVPPDTALIFEVELLEILPTGPDEPTEVDEDAYTTLDSGLQYVDLEEGSGAEVEAGQPVTVHYTGWLAEDGTRFDSSFDRGQPFTFVPGAGQVIPGWEEGVLGMREGGRRQLLIPSELGYGEQGAGGVIPPDATLIFEVEVVSVGEAATE